MSSSVDSPVAVAGKGMLRVVFYSAILFSVFQLVTSAFSPLSSTVVRALHVGFLLLLTFLLHPVQGGQGRTSPGDQGHRLRRAAAVGLSLDLRGRPRAACR